jgi:uncharacterized protein
LPAAVTTRLRVPLTAPQAVTHTSAVVWEPKPRPRRPRVGVVLAHSAGTDMTNVVLCGLARGLAQRGHVVATFNFAYAEANRRRPDPGPRLEAAFRDVLAMMRDRLGKVPPVIGGRSLGGRIASQLTAQGERCAGLLLLGYPLHPAGKPDRLRTGHWPELRGPILFVQGDRDRLCDLALLEQERPDKLAGADSRLHVVAGADHGFAVRKADGRSALEVLGEVVEVTAAWMQGVDHTERGVLVS